MQIMITSFIVICALLHVIFKYTSISTVHNKFNLLLRIFPILNKISVKYEIKDVNITSCQPTCGNCSGCKTTSKKQHVAGKFKEIKIIRQS